MKIETERLIAIPLTKYQLESYTNNKQEFIKYFKLDNTDYELSTELVEALENAILPLFIDNELYYFGTIWIIINKINNLYIGSFCFKGLPNENGEVEIGYGIDSNYRNNGYITEMLYGIIEFCKLNNEISAITAETDINNPASIKVLEKAGFVNIATNDTGEITYVYNLN